MSLTNTFSDLCKSFAPDAFAINYTLAKNPELSSHEFETVKTIGAVLEKPMNSVICQQRSRLLL